MEEKNDAEIKEDIKKEEVEEEKKLGEEDLKKEVPNNNKEEDVKKEEVEEEKKLGEEDLKKEMLKNNTEEDIIAKVRKMMGVKMEEKKEDTGTEKINRKVCAIEVLKNLNKTRIILMGSMITPFVVGVFTIFNKTAGIASVGIAAFAFGFLLISVQKEIKYLKEKYKL